MKISGGIKDGDITCAECGKSLQEQWSVMNAEDGTCKMRISPHYCNPKDPSILFIIEKLEGILKALKQRSGTYTG